jgi:glyoxylase-like metal-dependent hydrolase (beta-lactamase superfamily II)
MDGRDPGIHVIDTEYVRPRMDASHLIVDSGRAAFVDTGTTLSVPRLLDALAARGLATLAVDYIILTHIHLDHAGGAGRLAECLPGARVLVHPRGAAHLCQPERLIAATKAVYGEPAFRALYGEILPIASERITPVADGDRVTLGDRTLTFIHTPGHALHHLCVLDRAAACVFAGDTFGVSYRELDTDQGEFIFATTSPTQFDPAQLHASIDRILALEPRAVYLTHYGPVVDVPRLGADLHGDIDAFVAIARRSSGAADRVDAIRARLFEHLSARLDAHGFSGGTAARHAVLDGDIDLNAAGLAAWLDRVPA